MALSLMLKRQSDGSIKVPRKENPERCLHLEKFKSWESVVELTIKKQWNFIKKQRNLVSRLPK
jgi:hypothetical protein